MRLVWSPAALRQMREARDFIARENPDAADRLVALVEERIGLLRDFPLAGRAERGERRAMSLPPTPYSALYRADPGRVVILAVWHGARQWPPARD